MNIHEYQAKNLLKSYSLPVLKSEVARSLDEAVLKAKKMNLDKFVLKAQIHAGGRGKAGGVKLVSGMSEFEKVFSEMLGKTLITHQTGAEGQKVETIMIEETCQIKKEYYLAILMDRNLSSPVFILSDQGGMDIEEVAQKDPKAICKMPVDAHLGLQSYQLRHIGKKLKLDQNQTKNLKGILEALLKCFLEKDASLIEINPLILDEKDNWIILDAKMNFDSNALYRQKDILSLRDLSQEDPAEIEASKDDISFIKLNGSIGCMVNGAGLAMATMDIIQFYGSSPANFLDVGGGASEDKVSKAFEIILKDPNVKGILVNIFGGIMRCDVIAKGILNASEKLKIKVPLVVRLEGTRVDEGKKVLENSSLKIHAASSLSEAAKKIVELT